MSTAVKLFHSGMTGAPTLTGAAGSLLGVLQACLVDGWGAATVDSLTVSGGTATVTIGAGHPFEVDSVALIAGATVTGGTVNGEQRVLSVTATTYTFATTVGDQTATGTITHKVAPLGWERAFTGTNKAAYRPTDVEGTRLYLRVDDTGTLDGRVVGYETMSDVDTGTGPFPTEAQRAGGAYWPKSGTADATTRGWALIGDSRGIYMRGSPYGTTAWRLLTYFGDFPSVKSPDTYACALMASDQAVTNTSGVTQRDLSFSTATSTTQPRWAARSHSGTGTSVALTTSGLMVVRSSTSSFYSGGLTGATYPNPADDGLYLTPFQVSEGAGNRGQMPGLYCCPQDVGLSVFAHLERVTGVAGLTGKRLVAMLSSGGVYFFDLSGPWR
jgi:hypothetical protein